MPSPLVEIDHVFTHSDNEHFATLINHQQLSFETALRGHQLNLSYLMARPESEEREAQIAKELLDVERIKHSHATNVAILASLKPSKKAK